MHATWHDDRPIGLYTVLSRRKGGACDSTLLLHYWALCLIFVLWCNCLYYSHKIRFELKYHILYVNLFSSILSFNTSRVYRRFTGFFFISARSRVWLLVVAVAWIAWRCWENWNYEGPTPQRAKNSSNPVPDIDDSHWFRLWFQGRRLEGIVPFWVGKS